MGLSIKTSWYSLIGLTVLSRSDRYIIAPHHSISVTFNGLNFRFILTPPGLCRQSTTNEKVPRLALNHIPHRHVSWLLLPPFLLSCKVAFYRSFSTILVPPQVLDVSFLRVSLIARPSGEANSALLSSASSSSSPLSSCSTSGLCLCCSPTIALIPAWYCDICVD
jgi:hypothetical protein